LLGRAARVASVPGIASVRARRRRGRGIVHGCGVSGRTRFARWLMAAVRLSIRVRVAACAGRGRLAGARSQGS
jgi:hypothetical protein